MNKNIINSQSRYFVCDDKDIIQEFVKGLKKNHKLKNGDYIIIKYILSINYLLNKPKILELLLLLFLLLNKPNLVRKS